ncbi:MAG: uL15 family ribosomal protein [Sulfolobales archaeon]
MVVRRRRKSRKLRGRTRTMGWGNVGQHRKSGSRGGKGAVGFHKHKWMWVLKYFPEWYGKRGFTPRGPEHWEEIRGINLSQLEELVEKLRISGALKTEGEMPVIDLGEHGYNKLLGSGRISTPLKVIVKYATEKAVEAIKSSGGEVIIQSKERSSA